MEKIKDKDYYKVIKIPHLRFTLYIQDMSKLKGIEIKGGAFTTKIENGDYEYKACIFFEKVKETVKEPKNFPMVAHEVMHVIQMICEDYGMSIEEEKEHTAYLMSYITEQITN